MKKIILICGIMLVSGNLLIGLKASIVSNGKSDIGFVLIDTKIVKVSEEKLPIAIKNVLKSEIDKGWKINDIYLIKQDPEFYQITLKKDNSTRVKNLDKNGKLVISKN
jgi:hypothetical protein